MFAAEDIQRQVTVVIVVAVKEAPFLLAMQGQVGCVYIENDFFRRLFLGLEKHADEQLVDSLASKR